MIFMPTIACVNSFMIVQYLSVLTASKDSFTTSGVGQIWFLTCKNLYCFDYKTNIFNV